MSALAEFSGNRRATRTIAPYRPECRPQPGRVVAPKQPEASTPRRHLIVQRSPGDRAWSRYLQACWAARPCFVCGKSGKCAHRQAEAESLGCFEGEA